MQQPIFSEFERLMMGSENQLGTSILLILSWIASSDGKIDESESKQLRQISEASKHGHDTQIITKLAEEKDIEAIQLAAEIVRKNFFGEKANLFLEMAIGISIADGYLRPNENHILRFLSDLLGLKNDKLDELFVKITGKNIPDPTDPSVASFWQEKTRKQQKSDTHNDFSQKNRISPPNDQRTIKSYAILGLEFGATKEEIKQAYRRLAQIHHPDKFSSLGEEAVAAANTTFQKIQKAYNHLVTYV